MRLILLFWLGCVWFGAIYAANEAELEKTVTELTGKVLHLQKVLQQRNEDLALAKNFAESLRRDLHALGNRLAFSNQEKLALRALPVFKRQLASLHKEKEKLSQELMWERSEKTELEAENNKLKEDLSQEAAASQQYYHEAQSTAAELASYKGAIKELFLDKRQWALAAKRERDRLLLANQNLGKEKEKLASALQMVHQQKVALWQENLVLKDNSQQLSEERRLFAQNKTYEEIIKNLEDKLAETQTQERKQAATLAETKRLHEMLCNDYAALSDRTVQVSQELARQKELQKDLQATYCKDLRAAVMQHIAEKDVLQERIDEGRHPYEEKVGHYRALCQKLLEYKKVATQVYGENKRTILALSKQVARLQDLVALRERELAGKENHFALEDKKLATARVLAEQEDRKGLLGKQLLFLQKQAQLLLSNLDWKDKKLAKMVRAKKRAEHALQDALQQINQLEDKSVAKDRNHKLQLQALARGHRKEVLNLSQKIAQQGQSIAEFESCIQNLEQKRKRLSEDLAQLAHSKESLYGHFFETRRKMGWRILELEALVQDLECQKNCAVQEAHSQLKEEYAAEVARLARVVEKCGAKNSYLLKLFHHYRYLANDFAVRLHLSAKEHEDRIKEDVQAYGEVYDKNLFLHKALHKTHEIMTEYQNKIDHLAHGKEEAEAQVTKLEQDIQVLLESAYKVRQAYHQAVLRLNQNNFVKNNALVKEFAACKATAAAKISRLGQMGIILGKELSETKEALQETLANNKQLTQDLALAEQELFMLKASLKDLHHEHYTTETERAAYRRQLLFLGDKWQKLIGRHKLILRVIGRQKAKLAKLKSQLVAKDTYLEQLQDKMIEMQKSADQAQNDYAQKTRELSAEVARVSQKELMTRLSLAETQGALQINNEVVRKMMGQAQQLEGQVTSLQQILRGFEQKNKISESQKAALRKTIHVLANEIRKIGVLSSGVKYNLRRYQGRLARLHAAKLAKERELEQSALALTREAEEKDQLQQVNTSLQDRIAQAQQENSALQEQNDQIAQFASRVAPGLKTVFARHRGQAARLHAAKLAKERELEQAALALEQEAGEKDYLEQANADLLNEKQNMMAEKRLVDEVVDLLSADRNVLQKLSSKQENLLKKANVQLADQKGLTSNLLKQTKDYLAKAGMLTDEQEVNTGKLLATWTADELAKIAAADILQDKIATSPEFINFLKSPASAKVALDMLPHPDSINKIIDHPKFKQNASACEQLELANRRSQEVLALGNAYKLLLAKKSLLGMDNFSKDPVCKYLWHEFKKVACGYLQDPSLMQLTLQEVDANNKLLTELTTLVA